LVNVWLWYGYIIIGMLVQYGLLQILQ